MIASQQFGGYQANPGLSHGVFVLVAALGLAALVVVPFAYFAAGSGTALWALAAAALCFVTGMVALAVNWGLAKSQQPVVAMFVAMAVRTAPLLLVCLMIAASGQADVYRGFVFSLLVFYLAALAAETWHAVHLIAPARAPTNEELTDGV